MPHYYALDCVRQDAGTCDLAVIPSEGESLPRAIEARGIVRRGVQTPFALARLHWTTSQSLGVTAQTFNPPP